MMGRVTAMGSVFLRLRMGMIAWLQHWVRHELLETADEKAKTEAALSASIVVQLEQKGEIWLIGRGQSMLFSFWPGNRVCLRSTDGTERIGTVVAFANGGKIVAHRIVAYTDAGRWITKGDSLESEDAPVGISDILGVVSQVRWRGWTWPTPPDPALARLSRTLGQRFDLACRRVPQVVRFMARGVYVLIMLVLFPFRKRLMIATGSPADSNGS